MGFVTVDTSVAVDLDGIAFAVVVVSAISDEMVMII